MCILHQDSGCPEPMLCCSYLECNIVIEAPRRQTSQMVRRVNSGPANASHRRLYCSSAIQSIHYSPHVYEDLKLPPKSDLSRFCGSIASNSRCGSIEEKYGHIGHPGPSCIFPASIDAVPTPRLSARIDPEIFLSQISLLCTTRLVTASVVLEHVFRMHVHGCAESGYNII